jgi:hypothetical protein
MQLTVCSCQEEQTMGTTGLRQLPQQKQVYQHGDHHLSAKTVANYVCVFVMNLFAYQSSKFQHVPSLIPFNTSSLMFLQIENQLLL